MAKTNGMRALILAAGLAMFAGTAGAAQKISASAPVKVGATESDYSLAVAAQKAGGSLVAFSHDHGIFVRAISASGAQGTASVALATTGTSEFGISQASMATLTNGNIVVVWIALPGPRDAAFARVVRPDGSAVSSELTLSDTPDEAVGDATVAALANGGFAVGWSTISDNGKTTLHARAYSASGIRLGFETNVPATKGLFLRNPLLVPLGTGFTMVYDTVGTSNAILAQNYGPLANRIGKPVRLDAANALTHEDAVVTPLKAGGYAVAWRENTYSVAGSLPIVTDTRLKGSFVTVSGRSGKLFAVNDPVAPKSKESGLSIAETSAGAILGWSLSITRDPETNDYDFDIRGALISSAGQVGTVVPLTKQSRLSEASPKLATLKSGQIAMAFSQSDPTGQAPKGGAFASLLAITGK